MKVQRIHCSAVDRDVPIRLRPVTGGPVGRGAPRWEPATCLDYGVRCTGAMCPLFTLRELSPGELAAPVGAHRSPPRSRRRGGSRALDG